MADNDAKAVSGFLLSPIAGAVVAYAAFYVFSTPCEWKTSFGTTVKGSCMGSYHSWTDAVVPIGGICTLVGWAIVAVLFVQGKS